MTSRPARPDPIEGGRTRRSRPARRSRSRSERRPAPPGASRTSTVVTISAPASPASAYCGSATPIDRVTSTATASQSASSWGAGATGGKATLASVGSESERRRAASAEPPATAAPAYRETLRTPWWWYPVALAVAIVLAAEFHIAGYSLTDWIPFCDPAAVLGRRSCGGSAGRG